MAGILNWLLGIAWKTAVIVFGWICVKYVLRNGGSTLKEILNTTSLAIKAGCLTLRYKLLNVMQRRVAEKEKEHVEGEHDPDEKPSSDGECRVWGTVR
jgi:hypothetical protein